MVIENRQRFLIAGYLACFVTCAIVLQLLSAKSPDIDGSPIDYFTSALAWMSSLVCLLIAVLRPEVRPRTLLWIVLCAVFSFLAIDEMYAVHELSSQVVGDDDHVKLLQWGLAGVALVVLGRVERVTRPVRNTLLVGYTLHGLYVVTDLGDGDYFRIPWVARTQLVWLEELLEIFAMSFYLAGFLLLLGCAAMAINRNSRSV